MFLERLMNTSCDIDASPVGVCRQTACGLGHDVHPFVNRLSLNACFRLFNNTPTSDRIGSDAFAEVHFVRVQIARTSDNSHHRSRQWAVACDLWVFVNRRRLTAHFDLPNYGGARATLACTQLLKVTSNNCRMFLSVGRTTYTHTWYVGIYTRHKWIYI